MTERLKIDVVVSEPFQENSYIVHRDGDPRSFVIDPGFDPDEIVRCLRAQNLTLEAILLTHGHADHIAGCGPLKDEFPDAPIMIGVGDAPMLTDARRNLSAMGGMPVTSPPADILLSDGQIVKVLGLEWEVRDIPGHSPGHIVYVWQAGTPTIVFGGDVLFQGSIGRFDFPGSDGKKLLAGIKTRLYDLPEDTIVYPGHGDPTTVGEEKRTNPFTSDRFSLNA